MKKTYFISGSGDYDVKEFIRDYIPLLKQAILENANFVIGDQDGVDAMAQSFLSQQLNPSEHDRVKIFFIHDDPRNVLSTNCVAIGGFKTKKEANVAMTMCSDEDIVCLKPNISDSSAAQNVLRRFTPEFPFNDWGKAKDRNVQFWNIIYNDKNENMSNDKPELVVN